ncbi:hypothetical protein BKA67DRAFT_680204 [Truncatella angustata]|uniref:Uncharacterized protein n=1 Tax=Truncatella angustata TaxID=152316 RepID=A0A9P8ZWE5_9PEZI|nr:uncharacterized protein BKA67DRAFT_680204 [Truncatella angustata]KAH6651873.1 hypothetical protein BKA67DRAFT_680204 [Truncatella angustata]
MHLRKTENAILARLAAGQADHPGQTCAATLVENFFITSSNGCHQTIVTEVAGSSVVISKELCSEWMFPLTSSASRCRTGSAGVILRSFV